MSISSTSNIYVQFSSLFQKDQSSPLQGLRASFSALSGAEIDRKANEVQSLVSDILDLSSEGIRRSLAGTGQNSLLPQDKSDAEQTENQSGSELQSSAQSGDAVRLSEAQRVEQIRVNKNAVLNRINEILAEQGIEVSTEQAFNITVNMQTGAVSISGIEDAELLANMNEALGADEQLSSLMQKTRNELGVAYPSDVRPKNFTICFDSMIETPADAEISYQIDITINGQRKAAETPAEAEEGEVAETADSSSQAASDETPLFQLSIFLSNKVPSPTALLPEGDAAEKPSDKNTVSEKTTLEASETTSGIGMSYWVESYIEKTENGFQHFWRLINEATASGSEGARLTTRTELGGSTLHANPGEAESGWTFAGIDLTGTNEADFESLNRAFVDGIGSWVRNGAQAGLPDWVEEFVQETGIQKFVPSIPQLTKSESFV